MASLDDVSQCQHCAETLVVPPNLKLPPPGGIQRLRCGRCFKVSAFRVLGNVEEEADGVY